MEFGWSFGLGQGESKDSRPPLFQGSDCGGLRGTGLGHWAGGFGGGAQ